MYTDSDRLKFTRAYEERIDELLEDNARLRAALEKMQRSRDRYRQAWEAEKARAALAQGGDA